MWCSVWGGPGDQEAPPPYKPEVTLAPQNITLFREGTFLVSYVFRPSSHVERRTDRQDRLITQTRRLTVDIDGHEATQTDLRQILTDRPRHVNKHTYTQTDDNQTGPDIIDKLSQTDT